MKQKNILVGILFLVGTGCVLATNNNPESGSGNELDESTRLFSGESFDEFDKAFSGPNNTTNFPSETLFSLSDIGRKTYHMYRSTNYRLTRLANYQPLSNDPTTNEALSSPMLKITGSSITVDLNGFHLARQTTDVDGATTVNAVGIEIGYSPYDANAGKYGLSTGATFATVSQPENVTIRNGRIGEFGIGIVIHAGVKNVTLENLTISNAALGVVCAGQSDKPAVSIFLKNVRIENDGTDKSAVLAWAKSKLESTDNTLGYMRYGNGNIMPEQASPVGDEGTTLNVYSGILLVNTNNVSVYDVGCTNLGYARCVDAGSAAEGTASATFGINAINCTSLQLEKIDASNNASLRLVSGINISSCTAVTMTDTVATNNHIVVDSAGALLPTTTFGLWARGVSILNSQAITIDGLEVSRTLGASSVSGALAGTKSTAMGLYLDTLKVLNAKNIQSDYNDSRLTSAGLTFGIYTTGMDSGVYEHISASSNTGAAGADINLDNGSVVGMYFAGSCKDIQLKDVACNTNNSSAQYSAVRGIVFAGTAFETISLENVSASNNTQTNENGDQDAAGIYFGTAVTNLVMKNVHADKNTKTNAGSAYGMYFTGAATGVTMIDVDVIGTSGNTGAGGIHFDDTATNVKLDGVHGDGTNSSTGNAFGFKIDLAANNIEIKNSSFDNTTATGAGTVYGIWIPTSVSNLILENVTANYTHGTTATSVYGMLIDEASGVNAKNISANNTTGQAACGIAFTTSLKSAYIDGLSASGTNATSATATTSGLHIVAGDGVTVKNAQCNGTTSGAGAFALYGIDFATSASNVTLENIEVNNNSKTADNAYGLNMASPTGVTITNICATGNSSTTVECYGLNFTGTVTDITIDGCNASGNSGQTSVGGIYFETADAATLKNVTANNNGNATVSAAAIGIYCAGTANSVTLENVVANGNFGSASTTGARAGGILFADTANAGFVFKNVVASNNTVLGVVDEGTTYTPGTYAFGIKLGSANSLVASDINCSYNVGPDATQTTNVATAGSWNTVSSVGMWLDTPVAVQLSNVTCDYNGVGGTTTDAYVFGLLLDNPSSVTIDSISCSNNAGNALGAGLFANGGSSVSITNGLFNNNTSVAARVDTITNASPSANVNMSKHTTTPVLTVTDDGDDTFDNPQLLKGSYGIVMDSTDNVSLDTVTASQNSGFRAFGVQLRSCNGVQMTDCITNQQSATGALFIDGQTVGGYAETVLQAGTNGSAVVVPACSTSINGATADIFGSDMAAAYTVDLQLLMSDFLDTVTLLKDAPETPEIINNVNTMYSYHKPFVETSMLMRAIVAQVRAWGVAVGTQLNNCSDAVITNLVACGNSATKDSAFGLIFANNCTDCKVYGGQFNNNEAWAESALGYTFADTIDIREMNQFWSALDVDMRNFDGGGYVTSSDGDYDKLAIADVNADGRFTVTLADASTPELCNPCGPMAAGIVIGDTSARVDISDVMCAGNQGNAGQAYGLMHDVSVGASVQNSRFFQNMSNTCGIAFGLADFTPQSLSIHLGNSAFGNQYHLFMDSNYIVPFNPGEPYNMEFPTKVGYNGNITELANASVYDNIEIRFVYPAPTDPTNLPDGVFDDWETDGYTETPA